MFNLFGLAAIRWEDVHLPKPKRILFLYLGVSEPSQKTTNSPLVQHSNREPSPQMKYVQYPNVTEICLGGMLPLQLGYWFTAKDKTSHHRDHWDRSHIAQGTIEMSGTREARRWAKSSVWVRCCGTWDCCRYRCRVFNRGEVVRVCPEHAPEFKVPAPQ